MKLVQLVPLLSPLALSTLVACGGSSFAMVTTPGSAGKTIVVSTWVTPLGELDGLGSIQTAMSVAGCAPVKERYSVQSVDVVEATCNGSAITFKQDGGKNAGRNRVHAECDVAMGEPACKAQFEKVLDWARSARYVK